MLFSIQQLASLAAVVELAHAHGFVNLIKTGGKFYPGWDLQYYYQSSPPKVAGWSTTALDSGFVMPDAFQTGDIVCHRGGAPGQTHVPVVAGDTVQLYWNTWPDGHKGPVLDYMAACANNDCTTVDKLKLNFAKIDEVGLNAGTWGTDQLVANNNSWVITIPKSVKAGAYVLRHEIISLHSARSDNGAQAYPQCVNLMVSGGGSTVPSGEAATSFYTRTDPGILIDIYQGIKSYIIPGPAVGLSGGGSGGSAPTSAAPGTTMVTSTKPATTATSAKPTTTAATGGAPLYGQCGGTGWTGPTTCASGTCKASGSYYSQCVP